MGRLDSDVDLQKSCFSDTKENSADNQALVGGDSGGATCDDTPRNHNTRNPSSRGEVFHGDVGGEFEDDVWTARQIKSPELGSVARRI
jgi:hypothetical protein